MNQISGEKNIFCPDGVEFVKLGEIGTFYGGLHGKNRYDFEDGNAEFITYMNVYSNIAIKPNMTGRVKIVDGEKQNTVQFGDILFTASSETREECGMSSVMTICTEKTIYLNSFCFGFRLNNLDMLLPDFAKYLFRSSVLRTQIIRTAQGVTRYNVSKKKMLDITIPIPPLEVQAKIADILDKFTELEANLKRELELRRKQYEYYRDKLLTFNEKE